MEDNVIIRHLRELPLGDIYYLTPKQYFIRGFEYYRSKRLIYFDWHEDQMTLAAGIQGSQVYEVLFYTEKNRLQYECTCPAWSPSAHCKHVICALVAAKNIINPALFNIKGLSEEYYDLFHGILVSGKETSVPENTPVDSTSTFTILLEQKDKTGFFEIMVQSNTKIQSGYPDQGIPTKLRDLITASRRYYTGPGSALLEYLKRHGNLYPLLLRTGEGMIPLEWDPSLVFTSKTGIDVQQGIVSISKKCISDGEVCRRPYMLGERFVIDMEKRRMGIITDRTGWGLWYSLTDNMSGPVNEDEFDHRSYHTRWGDYGPLESIKIPLKEFQQFQLIVHSEIGEVLSALMLSVNGKAVSPLPAEHTYSMVIDQHGLDENKMVLKTCCNLGELQGMTAKHLFEFLPYVINGHIYSQPLRARKRRSVLASTFFRLLPVRERSSAERVIRESLSEGDFYKRAMRTEAKRLLMDAFTRFKTPSLRIQYYNGQWYLTRNNNEMEALLYTIPYEVLGPDIFSGMERHYEIPLPAEFIYRHLPELYVKLKKHDIPLYLKGKLVRTTRWDFAFDCRRDSGIDWFEIRPEISCDGEIIDEASLQRALAGNGLVEKGDFIEILDHNTQEVLEAIESVTKESKNTKGEIKEIVRVPRLQILDWIYLRNKGVKVRLSKEDEAMVERLNRFEKIEERPLPGKLKAMLRPYQKDGYYWLAFLYEHRFGACLADDMGLGKTLQAISLMAGIKEGKVKPCGQSRRPHLLVLPPSLLFNWEKEMERFYPDLKIYAYTGTERSTEFGNADVVLTTYGLVRRDIERLKEIPFNVIIFDEAQAVKNIYADTTGAVRQLKGDFKLTMTGTPVENHLGEYYSILDLSLPGLLGEYDEFKSHIKSEVSPFIDLILRRTRPFALRRTKKEKLKELPPKMETDIYLELSDKQKALYKKTIEMVRSTITDAYENKTTGQAQIIALTAILKLRQLCVSPKLVDPSVTDPSPKIEFLVGKLKELKDEGHSALVFSQFTSFLDILEFELKKSGLSFFRLDGSTVVKKRKFLVEGFQEGDGASIFLLSLKAGGQGLNLTRASYVFHLDPWWNPAVENQASDRAHRIGQKNKVTIMRILMRHTVEEKMMDLKRKKLALYKAVMEGTMRGKKGLSISQSDFDYLLA